MIAFALAFCLLTSPQDQQAINIEHQNGSRAHIARIPGTTTTAVRVCILNSSAESEEIHGITHLLEHMVAKAIDDVDENLESHGIFLRAETTRDGMSLFFEGSNDNWEKGLEIIFDLLAVDTISERRFQIERQILAQELRLVDWKNRLSAQAWQAAFDPPVLDPYGNIDTIHSFTAEDVEYAIESIIVAPAISVVVAGDVNVSSASPLIRELLGTLREEPYWERFNREFASIPPPSLLPTVVGAARGARVTSAIDPDAVSTLAFGFGFVSQNAGASIFLNPSSQESLIMLVATDRSVLDRIDSLESFEVAELYRIGLATVRRWARNVNERPSLYAEWKGWTLQARPGYSLEDLNTAAITLSMERFENGWARFRTGNTVEVIGAR